MVTIRNEDHDRFHVLVERWLVGGLLVVGLLMAPQMPTTGQLWWGLGANAVLIVGCSWMTRSFRTARVEIGDGKVIIHRPFQRREVLEAAWIADVVFIRSESGVQTTGSKALGLRTTRRTVPLPLWLGDDDELADELQEQLRAALQRSINN